ncbi:hypothetical protein IL306_003655 [Fusarium sp. DS 682]|nr:hypothetical protein IL306_003655 [Fusarium sp. DS 682]
MAEAVGLVASIIAIVELSAKVGKLCVQYSTAAGNARADIARLQSRLNDLNVCIEAAQRLVDDPNNPGLATSRSLIDSLNGCRTELAEVQARLDPSGTRKAMRRFGIRALKWPFNSNEISAIVSSLEHYKQTITLCLQVDQTTILLDMSQRFEDISLQHQGETGIARTPCFNVPFDRDHDFVARPDMTAWLRDKYSSSTGRMALVGMGGFGKSQVAIHFAHSIHDESPQTNIFWVHASSRPRFEEGYRAIAEKMKLPKRDDPNTNILALVHDWLQADESGSWLMILDNADDVNLFYPKGAAGRPLVSFLPRRNNGTVLITSRSLDVAERLTGSHRNIFQVTTMDEIQGLQLFKNKMLGEFEQDAAVRLLQALDGIPLAISQAAAYINRRSPRESAESYLKTFRENDHQKNNLLNNDLGDLRRDETVSNSVMITWQVTFDQIRRARPSAANLLSLMSFFNPHGIPLFALYNYNGYIKGSKAKRMNVNGFEDDLDLLRSYSLVSVTSTQDMFEMHATVQACTRAWISASNDQARWKRLFLRTMGDNFRCTGVEDWPTCQMLLPHLESVMKVEPPKEDIKSWVHLSGHCARYMIDIGKYKDAEDLSKQTAEVGKINLGEKDTAVLACLSNLALAYREQRKLTEAEFIQVQLLGKDKEMYGEEHQNTLSSMHNLAITYIYQHRNDEAEKLLIKVVDIEKNMLGDKHPDTLSTKANLVLTYKQQCRYEKAENLGLQVIEAKIIVLGPEHPGTLIDMHNLAWIYRLQGRFNEANELLTQVLDIRKRVLGEQHPDTLDTSHVRAKVLKDMGQDDNALSLMRYCADRYREVLGPEHPNTVDSASLLAMWEEETSRLSEQ